MNELSKRAHELAKSKGWYDSTRSTGELLMLVCTEIAEAHTECMAGDVEEMESPSGKPEGLPSELADVVIRIADLAGYLELDLTQCNEYGRPSSGKRQPTDEWFLQAFVSTSDACEWARTHDRQEMVESLVGVINNIRSIADWYEIDLEKAIETKMTYNATRPYRHGGKAF